MEGTCEGEGKHEWEGKVGGGHDWEGRREWEGRCEWERGGRDMCVGGRSGGGHVSGWEGDM